MKKLVLILLLSVDLMFSSAVMAEDTIDYNPGLAIVDLILYRPLGVAATVVGSALFVGFRPFTAIAQISPPHDAFKKTAAILARAPFEYTFSRPLGELDIDK